MKSDQSERKFLKSDRWEELQHTATDAKQKIPMALPQKPCPGSAELIELIAADKLTVGNMPLRDVIARRKSRRRFTGGALTLEELSFLLWATQGVRKVITDHLGTFTLRTVPSGGARHPFETYLFVARISGMEPGLYRYLPLDHKLCFLARSSDLRERIHAACYDQYVVEAAVTFIWTVIPYRTEWNYAFISPKIIAQDSGHLCQNLYLACAAIDAGTCAIGAYDQNAIDKVIGVDGNDEFTIYVAPVGKIEP